MRRAVLSTFLFVAILGLGCMGVALPGQAKELKHPIELGKECKALCEEYYDRSRSDTDQPGDVLRTNTGSFNFNFYNAFAYAYGTTGKYACGYDVTPRPALERCNFMVSDRVGGQASSPPGTIGNDLGGCKVYAKSPVNGKLAIVWKEEPRRVAKTEKKRLAELDRKKAVSEKKRLVEEARDAEQKRRAEQNKLASAIPSIILTRSQMLA